MPPSQTRVSGVAMTAAPHRDEQIVRAGKAHRLDHVRDAGAAGDKRRVPVDRAVPYPPMLFVALIAGTNQLAAEARRVLVQSDLVDRGHLHLLHDEYRPRDPEVTSAGGGSCLP